MLYLSLCHNFKKGEIYNISDDKPSASNKEIIHCMALKLLGV